MLTSCEQEDLLQAQHSGYIQFNSPSVSVEFVGATRGVVEDRLPVNGSFGVIGYCVPKKLDSSDMDWASGSADWNAKKRNAIADVFFNTKVTVQADRSCSYGTPKAWYDQSNNSNVVNGNDYQYSFFSWYPYKENPSATQGWTLNTPVNATTPGVAKLTYTMPFSGTNRNTVLDGSLVEDPMLAFNLNHQRGDGNVNFVFNHIMTGLRIKVINSNPTQDITLNSVKLVGSDFIRKVQFDMDQLDAVENLYTNSETFAGAFPFTNTTHVLAKDGGEVELENTILLLRALDRSQPLGENIQIEATYIYDGVQKTFSVDLPITFSPILGRIYTFTLAFVGNIFKVDTYTDQWEPGNGNDKDLIFN